MDMRLLLFGPFVILGHNWQTLQNGLVSIKQTEEKYSQRGEKIIIRKTLTPHQELWARCNSKMFLFRMTKKTTVLDGLNFKVNQGERIAFVGKSGVGKAQPLILFPVIIFRQKEPC